jgi:FkbH-like protein
LSPQNYTEILARNRELESTLSEGSYRIAVLGNITIDLLKELLEYSLRSQQIAAKVEIGAYDNIVQDSFKVCAANAVVVFWELANLTSNFHARASLMPSSDLDGLLRQTEEEILLVLQNLSKCPLVLFNRFSADIFTYTSLGPQTLDEAAARLNTYVAANAGSTVRLIDSRRVLLDRGVRNCLDWRQFYTCKAPYKVDFLRAYSQYIRPYFLAATGKAKKALILDCDNTLWNGILGEDGFDQIEMSPSSPKGSVFAEAQSIVKTVRQAGILIGLCSKNNHRDIEEVLQRHPDMLLRDEDLVIKKVGWSDKVTGLKEIAQELNIGLDSIVFVDDSSFEVEMVRRQLPEVTTVQVPANIYEYPEVLRETSRCFFTLAITTEDLQKTELYQQQKIRETSRRDFDSLDGYLASLGQQMTVYIDTDSVAARLGQMCQKTNQFNLTTKRYLESDIRRFMLGKDHVVVAFSLADRFGDNGITGLAILAVDQILRRAEIDVFLMSCRVVGRNAEYAFMDYLVGMLRSRQIETITSRYVPTAKNEIVRFFYDACGFSVVSAAPSAVEYALQIEAYHPKDITYIEILDGK